MDKKKIGESLASKRNQLGLSVAQVAEKIGCNRTSIERTEKGTSRIRRTMIGRYAHVYEMDAGELAKLYGYPANCAAMDVDSQITASVEDFEFLIDVARGLQRPMNITTIRELLKCRQAKK